MTWPPLTIDQRRDLRVREFWLQGLDTHEMSLRIGCHEADCCRSLERVRMRLRDERRAQA